jgi:hypothetical protein
LKTINNLQNNRNSRTEEEAFLQARIQNGCLKNFSTKNTILINGKTLKELNFEFINYNIESVAILI